MKIFYHTVLLALLIFATGFAQPANAGRTPPAKSTIYFDEEMDMTILPLQGKLELLYAKNPKRTIEETATAEKFKFILNAGYFSGSRAEAFPAGYLCVNGKIISKKCRSRQLTHIVSYYQDNRSMKIQTSETFRRDTLAAFAFQSGPLIIDRGKICGNYIRNSLNGKGTYIRTLIAYAESKGIFFITIRKPISLQDAAENLNNLPLFRGSRLSLLNLDGGPSVSFYSKENPAYNFNTGDTLPLLFGIR